MLWLTLLNEGIYLIKIIFMQILIFQTNQINNFPSFTLPTRNLIALVRVRN
jgi:hypothetical protein